MSSATVVPSIRLHPIVTFKDYVRAAAEGDTDEALSIVDPSIREAAKPKLTMLIGAYANRVKRHGGLNNIAVVNERTTGDYTTIQLEIKFNDASSEEEKVRMLKSGSKWYVALR